MDAQEDEGEESNNATKYRDQEAEAVFDSVSGDWFHLVGFTWNTNRIDPNSLIV